MVEAPAPVPGFVDMKIEIWPGFRVGMNPAVTNFNLHGPYRVPPCTGKTDAAITVLPGQVYLPNY